MASYDKIVICGEVGEGKVATTTRELLTTGRCLADEAGCPLAIVFAGENLDDACQEAVACGADAVYAAEGPGFANAHPDLSLSIFTEACKQLAASVVLLTHDDLGRDLAPRLAVRLKAAVTTDCTALSLEPETKRLLQSKPVYGGNAIAVWASEGDRPRIVTMRPRAAKAAERDASRQATIVRLTAAADASAVKGRILESVKAEVKGIRLEDAKVIVAGGGGIGGKEGFALLEELASVLGGTVGVSRVPCDEGWMPLSLEVGQTGHYVSPALYIAVGISGAPQHMTGCSASKVLVAINRDPDANVFKEANFGVVGDYRQVVPSLTERCKALLG